MNKEVEALMTFRSGKVEDKNFILATWLRGLYSGNSWFKEIPKDIFMKHYHDILMNILTRPTIEVKVAVLKEDEDIILGYSVYEGSTFHWMFVKEAWRRVGIGRSLLPEKCVTVTHLTSIGSKLKPKSMRFNPFII